MTLSVLLVCLPLLYWPHGVETAARLKQAGIERIGVPPDKAEAWRQAGFQVVPTDDNALGARERLAVPGISARAETVSATRSPWINANGWRFLRYPRDAYVYDLPAGPAALAAAEAYVYCPDAVLKIDPADVEQLGRMFGFLAGLPPRDLPAVADFAVVDDAFGSPRLGEVMNLLVRRNLLFTVVDAPASQFKVNVRLGTAEYPEAEAAEPSAFAQKVRRILTDEQRSLRLFGSEGVIARLTGDGQRARLALLNYGGREIEGLRVRLRGSYPSGEAYVAGSGRVPLQEHAVAGGATEFTLPAVGLFTVVDLAPSK